MVAVGALCPMLVLATWRRLRRPHRNIGELDKEIGLLRGLPMLQPLPLPAIEQLARSLEPVHLPAGQAVFHQGDPADRFYVIETGAADVVGDGRWVTALDPGEASVRLRCCAGCGVRPRCGRPPTWNFRL